QQAFKDRLKIFIQALAAKYDNNPDVAWIDIRSYGNYGECHTWGLDVSRDPNENSVALTVDGLRQYIKMYTDAFHNKQLILPRGNQMYYPVDQQMVQKGV